MMLLILIFLMADFFVSLKVGIEIGYLNSILWIIGSAILGGILLRLSPYALMSSLQNFSFGEFDIYDVQNASLSYLIGSILLIIPGVLSDIIGLVLVMFSLYLHLFAKIRPRKYNNFQNFNQNKGEDNEIIDVEIIDKCDNSNTLNNSK